MKSIIIAVAVLFAANAYAARIDCASKLTKGRVDKKPKITWCGAVGENIRNNGIKYRRRPRFCKHFIVEFSSIRSSDDKKFTSYCKNIQQKSCYMVKIKDDASVQGMVGLTSHMVFSSVEAMPANFSLSAYVIGHKKGIAPGPGTMVMLDLNCRVKQ